MFTEEQIRDSVRFANFCQAVKMEYWKTHGKGSEEPYYIQEKDLDEICLIAWKMANSRKAQLIERENTMTEVATTPAPEAEEPKEEAIPEKN